jgi:hypothetical protein
LGVDEIRQRLPVTDRRAGPKEFLPQFHRSPIPARRAHLIPRFPVSCKGLRADTLQPHFAGAASPTAESIRRPSPTLMLPFVKLAAVISKKNGKSSKSGKRPIGAAAPGGPQGGIAIPSLFNPGNAAGALREECKSWQTRLQA